ncbi:MAG: LytR C-terminal domain-containing protein [Bacteroidetes bacterium]|nr:LytR C-terminal domain-containing protein [Bacteroidota bacterium]
MTGPDDSIQNPTGNEPLLPEPPQSKSLMIIIGVLGSLSLIFIIMLIVNFSTQPPQPSDLDPEKIDPKLVIQIQVLNGNGVPKVTDQVVAFLRQQGFDVIDKGNYSSFNVAESVVIDRIGDKAAAKKLADGLGLPAARILTQVSWEYYADLTVVIGKDFKSLTPFNKK